MEKPTLKVSNDQSPLVVNNSGGETPKIDPDQEIQLDEMVEEPDQIDQPNMALEDQAIENVQQEPQLRRSAREK
ncbi:Retrovirus-related Pol polyprotein from transposon TNT 1-94 [Sesbania bispinosa]|nr:Retrovirus-related Pol polyprotein from transposon TNT 1-94 [Sesbania bispinosa]